MLPGHYLLEKVIKPLGLSIPKLAEELEIPPNRLYLIISGERSITADTALRLGHYFGTGPEMWLHLQIQADIAETKEEWKKAPPKLRRFKD